MNNTPRRPQTAMHNTPRSNNDYFDRQYHSNYNDTLNSQRSHFGALNIKNRAKRIFKKGGDDDSSPPQLKRLQTARDHNKKFIMDRIQTV